MTGVLDPALDALVRLAAGVASLPAEELGPVMEGANVRADPLEVEEALLQSFLFLGYPAALNAFAEWRRVSGRPAPEPTDPQGPEEWPARGEATCRRVYGSAYEALRRNIRALSPELDRWMVVEGYGRVLGRPGMELGHRECCIVAMLAVRDVPRQLHSHLRGALRCGVPESTLRTVLETALDFSDEVARRHAWETWDMVSTSGES